MGTDRDTVFKQMRRIEKSNRARYVTFSNYRRLPLLGRPAIRNVFADVLVEARTLYDFRLIAWVAMPEHVHMILMPRPPEESIVEPLWWLKREVGRRVVARWRELDAPILGKITLHNGRVKYWQPGGGYDRVIRSEHDLIEKIRYIHLNPVRRGLVEQPEDWAWSSARWYKGISEGQVPIDYLL